MIFNSKVDLWLLLLFLIITIVIILSPYIYYKKSDISLIQSIFYLILPMIFSLTLIWLPFFKIKYTLTSEQLTINNGFSNTVIPVKNIVKLNKTNNLVSSPALSLDRIRVTYMDNNRSKDILISPKDSDKFISLVTKYKMDAER